MTETHSMRLNIDGSGAQKGAATYKNAVNQIISSTKAMKAALDATSGTKPGAAFKDIAKGLAEVSRIKISGQNAANIRALNSAMAGFKGPSTASVKNTRAFFRDLAAAQLNKSIGTNLAAISQAMAQFKGPSQAGVKNTRAFFRELNSLSVSSRVGTQLGAITSALSGFKGPSTAQTKSLASFFQSLNRASVNGSAAAGITRLATALASMPSISSSASKNLSSLVTSLNSLRSPQNVQGLVAVLLSLSTALNAANGQSIRFSNTLRTVPFQKASSDAAKLTGDMRGLENAFSTSYQLGSQLRVLFGSLTLGQFSTDVYQSAMQTQRFSQTMSVTASSVDEASASIQSIRAVANNLGLDMATVYEEFGKFSTSARLAGQSANDTMYIYESFGGAMRVMGLEASRQQLVWKALTQMFSKGKVSAEELNQQLGDQLPGAFTLLQDALRKASGDSTLSLANLLKQGKVSSNAVLLLAREYRDKFGKQVENASQRVDAALGRLSNAWFDFKSLVAESGLSDAIGAVADQLTVAMNDQGFRQLAVTIGGALAGAIRDVGGVLQLVVQNAGSLGTVLGAVLISRGLKGFASLASAASFYASRILSVGTNSQAASVGVASLNTRIAATSANTAKIGMLARAFSGLRTAVNLPTTALNGMMSASGKLFNFMTGALPVVALAYVGLKDQIVTVGDQQVILGDVFNQVGKDIISGIGTLMQWFGSWFDAVSNYFTGFQIEGTGSAGAVETAFIDAFTNPMKFMDDFYKNGVRVFLGLKTTAQTYIAWWKDAFSGEDPGDFFQRWNQTAIDNGSVKRNQELNDERPVTDYFLKAKAEADKARAEAKRKFEETQKKALQNPNAKNTEIPTPDFGAQDYIIDSAKETGTFAKSAKDAEKATLEFADAKRELDSQFAQGKISIQQYNALLESQAAKLRETTDPYAALMASMREENSLLQMGKEAQQVERDFREAKNALLEKGIALTDQESEALRKLIAQQQELQKGNPYKDYIDGIKDFGRATDEIAVNAVDGLADQISSLVATGKADFASLAQSILQQFIKSGLQTMFKSFFEDSWGGTKKATTETAVGSGFLGESTAMKAAAEAQAEAAKSAFKDTQLRGSLDMNGQAYTGTVDTSQWSLRGLGDAAQYAASALGKISGVNPSVAGSVPGVTTTKAYSPVTEAAQTATAYSASSKTLALTSQEITDLKKTLMTEVAGGLKGPAYDAQAAGVVDTILNRKVSGRWGDSVTSVVNAKSQFSDINGAVAWKAGRSSTADIPVSDLNSGRGLRASQFVDSYLAKRAAGQGSSVGGDLSYANPNYSDAKNMGWINQLQGPTLGAGDAIHKHGTPAGMKAVDPNYRVQLPGQTYADPTQAKAMDFVGNYKPGVDQRLTNILQDATANYEKQTGYKVQAFSGLRPGDKRLHGQGMATDVKIIDPATGKEFGNYQDASGFRTYEQFAQQAKLSQERLYPDMDPKAFRWGGYFGGDRSKYGSLDSMHFDLGGERGLGMAGGSWENGLNAQQRKNYPGATSIGMSQGIDPSVTNSLTQANTQLQQLGTTAQQSAQQAQQASQQQQMAQQTKIAGDQQAAMSMQSAGTMAMTAGPQFQEAGQAIASAGQTAASASKDMNMNLGSLSGMLGSAIPGAGPYMGWAQQIMGLFGMFKEGGIATDPVAYGKMPHYAEGTANTGSYGRGGIPSVLHPNEAVIPLSRGRKVPVEMNNTESRAPETEFSASRAGGNTFNLNLSGIKSADDFKKSKRQINASMSSSLQRAQRRNA